MKMVKCLEQHKLLEKGIDILYKKLGPVEARRFIALTRTVNNEDSVKRHHRWQASLNKDDFMDRIRVAHAKALKK